LLQIDFPVKIKHLNFSSALIALSCAFIAKKKDYSQECM